MKRILIAIMFVIGFSAVAQAKIVHLKCGLTAAAIEMKKKKIVETSFSSFDKVKILELQIYLTENNTDFYLWISRVDLSYQEKSSSGIRDGTCQMGRKF